MIERAELWCTSSAVAALYWPLRHAGAVAMSKSMRSELEGNALAALSLMEEALALLDRDDFALDVGAHLDLAICRLREVLGIEAETLPDDSHALQPFRGDTPGGRA